MPLEEEIDEKTLAEIFPVRSEIDESKNQRQDMGVRSRINQNQKELWNQKPRS